MPGAALAFLLLRGPAHAAPDQRRPRPAEPDAARKAREASAARDKAWDRAGEDHVRRLQGPTGGRGGMRKRRRRPGGAASHRVRRLRGAAYCSQGSGVSDFRNSSMSEMNCSLR